MTCLSPFEQWELNYLLIPETIVLFLTSYGFYQWIKTKSAFGMTGVKKPVESVKPRTDLPITNDALPPPKV